MKNVVGQVARDDDFFPRDKIIKRLWKQIKNGSSVLISAPRRVGKTSIMRFMQDNSDSGYEIIYIMTESIDNESDYYKRLWDEVLENDLSETGFKKFKTRSQDSIKKIISKISSVKADGVDLANTTTINYYERFVKLLKEIELYGDKLIIMVDEFPQTIENIRKKYDESSAIKFLQENRELRQHPKISDKVQFMYAGSIGLENIVNNLNANSTTNDLNPFTIEPLTQEESEKFISELEKTEVLKLSKELKEYIIKKIEWLIPYFIQITIKELSDEYSDSEEELKEDSIDKIFQKMITVNNYFSHWNTRLNNSYKDEKYKFIVKVLNLISQTPIDINTITNIAMGFNLDNEYKDILRALEHDGYIHKDENNFYRFTSPILKMWWNRNVAN
jgi:hypothetical protein